MDDAYLSSLCLELSLIVRAGVPFADGFLMLRDDDNEPASAALMERLSHLCENGLTLNAAFKEAGGFPPYLLSALHVAERTGRLEASLRALSAYYDRQRALKKSVKNAVAYPSLLVFIMLAVILVLLWGVLPVFDSVYAQLGLQLSPFATFFMRLSRSVSLGVLVLAGACALFALFFLLLSFFPRLKNELSRRALACLSATNTGKAVSRARFASAMTMALASGLDTDEALSLVRTMFTDAHDALKRVDACADCLREGRQFDDALYISGLLSARDSRMAGLGVKTGSIETVMSEIAERAETYAQESIDALLARIEPALVLAASVVIGGILLSVMLPLAGIMSSIG